MKTQGKFLIFLSIWLFHLFTMGQITLENIFGYSIPGRRDLFMEGSVSVAYQGMGAMLVLVFYGLWNSRSHLGATWNKAFSNGDLDDESEILSYRSAFLLLMKKLFHFLLRGFLH